MADRIVPAPQPQTGSGSAELVRFHGPDGLGLAARLWHPDRPDAGRLPLLCLPGLSRNWRDFRDIAAVLAGRGRLVVALDYRGRGDSDHDAEWHNYAIPVEAHDVDAGIARLGLGRFAVLGTSRGGLHAMAMAHRYPAERMRGVILNDVGPRIELRSILRIAASLGRHMQHPSFEALADLLKSQMADQFPKLDRDGWQRLARQLGRQTDEAVRLDYDPALALTLAALDDATPWPDQWPLFMGLADRPVLAIRGARSDLLAAETLALMAERHPQLQSMIIDDEGHAPLLWDQASQDRIEIFLNDFCDV
ncbi:alpha/beta fold hydrolase [Pannonibacter tanglangensis]|uniref:Alpha/beta fold hydrolase n=1 Tax=Pannonibacter tanglangensis TaxID=2750084 RepID=A0ABW9ZCK3_9HYPH|nr:alpha/beta fold hydrolase [Pannonibacter sp. XCT-34]NBN62555.1 alpha/beta fold hydrolase [Pannonibacter sp. XCT-34]